MLNRNREAAWEYHDSTKHSWESVRTGQHYLDWPNRPRPFKIYQDLKPIALPDDFGQTGLGVFSAISSPGISTLQRTPMRLRDLAGILYFSAGITRRRAYSGMEILFRAASCTGALYSIELYAVCGKLDDLDAGVYHFDPSEMALRRLRSGDHRGRLAQAAAGEPAVSSAPVTIVCTGTYWRNAWKYRARTYRHFGWDNGTILANMLAAAAARNLPAKVVNGFVDDRVNPLLGLNTEKEVALNLVPVGRGESPREFPPAPSLEFETLPYSQHELDYPAMRKMHEASSLQSEEEAASWRGKTPAIRFPEPKGALTLLEPTLPHDFPKDSIEQSILRRGSTRRFSRSGISFREFATALYYATQGIPADFIDPHSSQLNDLYIVCHAVEGLAPGAYVLHRKPWALELLKKGEFRKETGYLGLEQDLAADCSAAVFLLADLNPILSRFGNRGYRATQLEAGIIGGRLYLGMYGQHLGATGLTFYDDDVTRFFSPHAQGKSAIFLMALGRSAISPNSSTL